MLCLDCLRSSFSNYDGVLRACRASRPPPPGSLPPDRGTCAPAIGMSMASTCSTRGHDNADILCLASHGTSARARRPDIAGTQHSQQRHRARRRAYPVRASTRAHRSLRTLALQVSTDTEVVDGRPRRRDFWSMGPCCERRSAMPQKLLRPPGTGGGGTCPCWFSRPCNASELLTCSTSAVTLIRAVVPNLRQAILNGNNWVPDFSHCGYKRQWWSLATRMR